MGKILLHVLIFIVFVGSPCIGRDFQNLSNYVVKVEPTSSNLTDDDLLRSDYIYGDCRSNSIKFYNHTRLEYWKLKSKIILRGWLNITHLPSCVILRGTSTEEDNYKATAFNFQICVARLKFIYNRRTWLYYYYEWFIPIDFSGTMNWDLYFYGPDAKDWISYQNSTPAAG